jgi:hypothetical protein
VPPAREGHDAESADFLELLRAKNRGQRRGATAHARPPAATAADDTPTTRDVEYYVGPRVRRAFLRRVTAICWEHAVRWTWGLESDEPVQRTIITLSGRRQRVEDAAAEIRSLADEFPTYGPWGVGPAPRPPSSTDPS